jgi:uncharacterized protein DUF397
MAAHDHDLSRAAWLKSTYSSQDGNCVEVATNLLDIIAIRDSKDSDGPELTFTPEEWAFFTDSIKGETSRQGS